MASSISVSVSEQQRQSAILKACVRSDLYSRYSSMERKTVPASLIAFTVMFNAFSIKDALQVANIMHNKSWVTVY